MFVMSERVFRLFNLCEGILWITIALALALVCLGRREDRDLTATGVLLFLAFGISDFVETQTGGWYKPWWLFAWNAATVLGFVIVYLLFRKRRRQAVPEDV